MSKVFILYEERESSQLCSIVGAWPNRNDAIAKMKKLISLNSLYSSYSHIDFDNGYAESDPLYSEESYSNFFIKEFEII